MATHSPGLIQSAIAADYIHDYALSCLIQSMAADYIHDYALSWFNTVNGS